MSAAIGLPVALSRDIAAGAAFPAVVAGEEIVLWRDSGSQLRAWPDRCPHRGMRLSFGFVRGDRLACLYHGWQWRADGGCALIPAHPDLEPPETLRVSAYPCAERDGLAWLAEAAPALPEGLAPVRSLTVAVPVAALSAVLPQMGMTACALHQRTPTLPAADGSEADTFFIGNDHALAIRPRDPARTTLHLFTRADPVAASRWAENLRRRIETAA